MVKNHLMARDITDGRVLEAFRKVPRHLFVPEADRSRAYEDHPLSIGCGQTISQPYMVALMSQCLALGGWENVLEIGTGSGYQTAILAELAQTVHTIERIDELSDRAQAVLVDQGYENINFRVGDGTLGWPEASPFDRIIVTAAAPHVPETLKLQLGNGGLLVVPVGPREGQQLLVIRRDGKDFEQKNVCACIFVKLVGKEGYSEPDSGGWPF
jgi:protein-L-isoaspartate(D-aspartate) O-methyltransferase